MRFIKYCSSIFFPLSSPTGNILHSYSIYFPFSTILLHIFIISCIWIRFLGGLVQPSPHTFNILTVMLHPLSCWFLLGITGIDFDGSYMHLRNKLAEQLYSLWTSMMRSQDLSRTILSVLHLWSSVLNCDYIAPWISSLFFCILTKIENLQITSTVQIHVYNSSRQKKTNESKRVVIVMGKSHYKNLN